MFSEFYWHINDVCSDGDLAVPSSETTLTFKHTQRSVTQVNHDAAWFEYVKYERSGREFQMTGWNFPPTAKKYVVFSQPRCDD